MGKTKYLFQKTGDAKGTFYAKMGTIKKQKILKEEARIHRTTMQKRS